MVTGFWWMLPDGSGTGSSAGCRDPSPPTQKEEPAGRSRPGGLDQEDDAQVLPDSAESKGPAGHEDTSWTAAFERGRGATDPSLCCAWRSSSGVQCGRRRLARARHCQGHRAHDLWWSSLGVKHVEPAAGESPALPCRAEAAAAPSPEGATQKGSDPGSKPLELSEQQTTETLEQQTTEMSEQQSTSSPVAGGPAATRAEQLACELHALWEEGLFCDVALVTGETCALGHQVVLGAACTVLRDCFLSGTTMPALASSSPALSSSADPSQVAGPVLPAPPQPRELRLEAELLDQVYRGSSARCASYMLQQGGGSGTSEVELGTIQSDPAAIVAGVQELRSKAQLCDLVLVTKSGAKFVAHQAVLAAASNVFRDYLIDEGGGLAQELRGGQVAVGTEAAKGASTPAASSSVWPEMLQPFELEFDCISQPEALCALLDYVYGTLKTLPGTLESLEDLLRLADGLDLTGLAALAKPQWKAMARAARSAAKLAAAAEGVAGAEPDEAASSTQPTMTEDREAGASPEASPSMETDGAAAMAASTPEPAGSAAMAPEAASPAHPIRDTERSIACDIAEEAARQIDPPDLAIAAGSQSKTTNAPAATRSRQEASETGPPLEAPGSDTTACLKQEASSNAITVHSQLEERGSRLEAAGTPSAAGSGRNANGASTAAGSQAPTPGMATKVGSRAEKVGCASAAARPEVTSSPTAAGSSSEKTSGVARAASPRLEPVGIAAKIKAGSNRASASAKLLRRGRSKSPAAIGRQKKRSLDEPAVMKPQEESPAKRAKGDAPQQRQQQCSTLWMCKPVSGHRVGIRLEPWINAPRVGQELCPGDLFRVDEEVQKDGVLYLHLADRRGWLFNCKPGTGTICVRASEVTWVCNPVSGNKLGIRGEPTLEAPPLFGKELFPGEEFFVSEELVAVQVAQEVTVTFLRLADGRGWVFNCKPGVGVMCTKKASTPWVCQPVSGNKVGIRVAPSLDAPKVPGAELNPGEVFQVSEQITAKSSADDIVFLRLTDGRGWVFSYKPGVGVMCLQQQAPEEKARRAARHEASLDEASMPPPATVTTRSMSTGRRGLRASKGGLHQRAGSDEAEAEAKSQAGSTPLKIRKTLTLTAPLSGEASPRPKASMAKDDPDSPWLEAQGFGHQLFVHVPSKKRPDVPELTACMHCGAWATKSPQGLCRPCPGAPHTAVAKTALVRLREGKHPHYRWGSDRVYALGKPLVA